MKNITKSKLLLFALVSIVLSGCNGIPDASQTPEVIVVRSEPPEPTVDLSSASEITAHPSTSPPIYTPEVTWIPEPEDSEFVKVVEYIPGIVVELKYSTQDNFVGEVIYDFSDAWLRYGTVKKLRDAQNELVELGFGIKIWDAFRPVTAQFTLWEKVPNARYVANPNTGYSSHSTGNTVDVTLVDSNGIELEMPSGFDDFSALADRAYWDVSEIAAENSLLLENVMTHAGFVPYTAEWWHYSDTAYYSPETTFSP